MANVIKPKRSNTASAVPTTGQITGGEMAVNMADRKIWINNGTSVVQIGAGKLSALEEVTITSPSNGDVLKYNTSTSKWENGGVTASTATNVSGGAANQILYQTGASTTSFITAPNTTDTYLKWTGSAFTWATVSSSTTITKGTATIDFGSHPGTNEATVAVTGQTGILATSQVWVTMRSDDTSTSHTAQDHSYFLNLAALTTNTPTAGIGFTITARSIHKLTGTWTVRWSWI